MSYVLESALVQDCKVAADALGVCLEVIGQRKAKGSGTDRGVADALLHAGGKSLNVEFKRPESDGTRAGRFSLDQLAAAERRRHQGVETYAPSTLEHFVALVNWARCGTGPVCRGCPTVPRVGADS